MSASSLLSAAVIDHRPANGSGSCARCGESLGLASLKQGELWYCSSSCAVGRVSASPREPRVPEAWLYARPRRHFRKRQPKELQSAKLVD
jgi:hypothetical protein